MVIKQKFSADVMDLKKTQTGYVNKFGYTLW